MLDLESAAREIREEYGIIIKGPSLYRLEEDYVVYVLNVPEGPTALNRVESLLLSEYGITPEVVYATRLELQVREEL